MFQQYILKIKTKQKIKNFNGFLNIYM